MRAPPATADRVRHDQAEQHERNSTGSTPDVRNPQAVHLRHRHDRPRGGALTVAQGLRAAQPGYAGSIVVAGGQRFIAVNLWRTEDDASAGRGAIGAQVQRLLKPLMTAPSQLLAVGEVVASDLGSPSITQATTTSADDDSEHHDHS